MFRTSQIAHFLPLLIVWPQKCWFELILFATQIQLPLSTAGSLVPIHLFWLFESHLIFWAIWSQFDFLVAVRSFGEWKDWFPVLCKCVCINTSVQCTLCNVYSVKHTLQWRACQYDSRPCLHFVYCTRPAAVVLLHSALTLCGNTTTYTLHIMYSTMSASQSAMSTSHSQSAHSVAAECVQWKFPANKLLLWPPLLPQKVLMHICLYFFLCVFIQTWDM